MIWIAQRGGRLHGQWPWLIEHALDHFASLERDGKTTELNEIRAQAPNAVPSHLMRTLWRLVLSRRVKAPRVDLDFYRWKERVQRDGLTATLRLQLRDILAPQVVLKKPLLWSDAGNESGAPTHIKQLVDWELVLASDHVHTASRELADGPCAPALPLLLDDFQQLLCDAMDLLRELGDASDRGDRSHWDLPSIAPHWQNRGFREWVCLIELLRDAWLAVRKQDGPRATRIAQSWFEKPYPTFKRLALFAASQDDCIESAEWVEWLLLERARWLWSVDTGREMFRLLVLKGRLLTGSSQERMEAAILAGPPRDMYRDDIEPERLRDLEARMVWLRLAKLSASGLALGFDAKKRFAELSGAYPRWQLAANGSDEFSHWMSGTGDPDYEENREITIAPPQAARAGAVVGERLSRTASLP